MNATNYIFTYPLNLKNMTNSYVFKLVFKLVSKYVF